MRKQLSYFPIIALCALMCSCNKGTVDTGSDVCAAVSIQVTDITASSATVKLVTTQTDIKSYKVVTNVKSSVFDYAGRDPVTKLDFINNNSVDAAYPYEQKVTGMDPSCEYIFGVIGLDSLGTVITAPTFTRFSTGFAEASAALSFVTTDAGAYVFTGTITANENVASYRYLFGAAYGSMKDDALKALLSAGGPDVKTGTKSQVLTLAYDKPSEVALAVLAYDDAGREANYSSAFSSAKPSATVAINGTEYDLKATNDDATVFEGVIAVPASCSFTVNLSKNPYGFTSFSGNGGLGTVNSNYAAVPYYNGNFAYSCNKAVGRMTKMADGGNRFWINLGAASNVLVKIDNTNADGVPRYYLEVEEAADAGVILNQRFDLFVWGGEYLFGTNAKGTAANGTSAISAAIVDGTEPGTQYGCAYTDEGTSWWKTSADIEEFNAGGTSAVASETYLKNRDMAGWDGLCLMERPGAIRINRGSKDYGYLTTPALTALTSKTDITVEFDIARNASDRDIHVVILGSGAFGSALVNQNGDATATDYSSVAGGTFDFTIDGTMCSKYANDFTPKPWTHVKLTVEAADATTRIKIDCTRPGTATSKDARIFLDNIRITR
jgi:hypothetical protein